MTKHTDRPLTRYEMARARYQLYGPAVCQAMWERVVQNGWAAKLEAYDARQAELRRRKKRLDAARQTPQRYERTRSPRPDHHGQRSTSAIYDIVRDVVASFEPAITEAIWDQIRRSMPGGISVPRTSGRSFYERDRTPLHQYGQRFFDESKHPRAPAGRPEGGQFIDAHRGMSPGVVKNPADFPKKPVIANQANNMGAATGKEDFLGGAISDVGRRRQSGRGIARLSQSPKRNNATSKHVYADKSDNVYVNSGWWNAYLGYRNEQQVSRGVDGSLYRVPIEAINRYVDEYWDFVKDWGAPEWDQYFRLFGTPAPKAFQEINRGVAQRIELSEVARPGLRPEDIQFYQGMVVFAGAGKFVEVAYPIVMTEILSAIFIEPMVGAVVTVEAGTLVITQGKRVIKVAGTKLDEMRDFLLRSRNVKQGAKLEEVGDALQKVLNQTSEKFVPVKIPKVGSSHPDLPVRKYDDDPTHGIFNDKKSLMSGPNGGDALEVFAARIPQLSRHAKIALKHVEGHAAAEMATKGLTEAVVHINYKTGPCPHCLDGVHELLSEGQKLWVVFPDGVGYFTNKGWTPLK